MISYCVACYRPVYARLLLQELVRKTSTPFEILLWLNVEDAGLDADIADAMAQGVPLTVVGRSPHNIGMTAYLDLFRASRYPLIAQIDDDVVCMSRGLAERAAHLFARFPQVRQVVADVWQDDYTTGARPPLAQYRVFDALERLYEGPVDGWFSVYHRSVLPMLLRLPVTAYYPIGATMCGALAQRGVKGVLDGGGMKVFHVVGPDYARAFGMLDHEIAKYRRLNRQDIVDWYEASVEQDSQAMAARVEQIRSAFA
jgi:hypothetical protein